VTLLQVTGTIYYFCGYFLVKKPLKLNFKSIIRVKSLLKDIF